jgi:hypothetical protein
MSFECSPEDKEEFFSCLQCSEGSVPRDNDV